MLVPPSKSPAVFVANRIFEAHQPSVDRRRAISGLVASASRSGSRSADPYRLSAESGLFAAGTRCPARAELGVAMGKSTVVAAGDEFADLPRPSHADPTIRRDRFPGFRTPRSAPRSIGIGFLGPVRRAVESADAAYLGSIASYDDALSHVVATSRQPVSASRTSKPNRDRRR